MCVAIRRFILGAHVLALADQVVVSGASFLATVVIARSTDSIQLGAYAIGVSLLASVLTVQESLILLPYSIQRYSPLGTPAEHAGISLTLSGLLSAANIMVLVAVALGLSMHGAQPEVVAMTWALAATTPFVLSREFGRRFSFAHLQLAHALILDSTVAFIQLAVLSWLASAGRMSVVAACVTLGGACGLTALGWLYLARADFAFRLSHVRATIRQSWGLGKWLFVGQMTVLVQRYVIYWLSLVIAGPAVTGVYAACMSVVAFANPVIFGLGNILTPRSVSAWKNGGGTALRSQAIHDTALLGAVLTAFCIAIALCGEDLMHFLSIARSSKGRPTPSRCWRWRCWRWPSARLL